MLTAHALLLIFGTRRNFVCVDEVGHVPAGLSHWETGTFSAYRVNPPLSRMLASLPLLCLRPTLDLGKLDPAPGRRPEWALGRSFSADNADRYFDLVCIARLAGVAWSVLGGWLVYRWARDLYGARAGSLGLLVWCFEPNVLAYAMIVGPDMPSAVCGLGATYVFWRYLRDPSGALTWAAGLALGVAQLTKFTLLALYPVWLALGAVSAWTRPATVPSPRPAVRLGQAALIVGISLYVINLGYLFEGTCRPLGELPFVSRALAGSPAQGSGLADAQFGNRFRQTWLGAAIVPLPADYVQGMDMQRRDFEAGWNSYLRGEWRTRGWWYYYLYALAVKVPLGLWALFGWGLGLLVVRRREYRLADETCLLLPAAAFLAFVSSQTGFNHHMRYVFPLFPFVAVSVAKLGVFLSGRTPKAGLLVAALLGWSVGSSLSVYPHCLSYFNEAAGGPANGSAHLVDSNLDWGQDLLELADWLDRHPEARPFGLAYYNFIDPQPWLGTSYVLPPPLPADWRSTEPAKWPDYGPRPGYYALDVNFVRGAAFVAPNGWGGLKQVQLDDYAYFQRFRPVARAGYSIYVYHLTPEEADRARAELGLPPLRASP